MLQTWIALLLLTMGAVCLGCSPSPTGRWRPNDFFDDAKVIALALAAEKGDVKEIDRLVAEGVDINTQGKEGMTVLFWAMWAKNREGFTRLLERGADPNERRTLGYSVMAAAAGNDDTSEWLEIVLKHGGNPNFARPKDESDINGGATPIWFATGGQRAKNLELLIQAGVDINHQNQYGSTPMMDAAGMGWFDTVYRLLEAGADYRIKDNHGYDLAYEALSQPQDNSWIGHESGSGHWRAKVLAFLEKKGVDFEPIRKKIEEKAKARKLREQEEERRAEERRKERERRGEEE